MLEDSPKALKQPVGLQPIHRHVLQDRRTTAAGTQFTTLQMRR
jgi:hypothetical protein